MLTRRKAFTVLELLLVIGIIVVLAGLVIWGLSATGGQAAKNSTRVTLQNLTSMLEELNRKTKLAGIEGPQPPTGQLPPIFIVDMTLNPPIGGEAAPGMVTEASDNMDRRGFAVSLTAEVIRRMMALPDNKAAIEKLPSNQVMSVNLPAGAAAPTGTVILDGWHNPILFVPSAGLQGVLSKPGATTYSSGTYQRGARVTQDGVYWTAIVTTSSPPSIPDWFQGVRSPDGRAFWASAGPDGAFSRPASSPDSSVSGDDNIYSFEQ